MALVAGSLDADGNFTPGDCLAKRIDEALPSQSAFGQLERRQLLIAIATGIIEYLKAHAGDSFSVSVTVSGTTYPGTLTIS